jgi:PAS domain S-box-containing protein
MEIDLRTLILMLGITHFIQVLVFYYHFLLNKSNTGIWWWILWSIAEAAGFSFMLLRGIPQLLPYVIIVQNVLIIAGIVFLYVGITWFLGKKVNLKLLIPPLSVYLVLLFLFDFAWDNIEIRTLALSLTIAYVSGLTTYTLYRFKTRLINTSANLMAVVMLLHGGIYIYRSIIVLSGVPLDHFFNPTPFNMAPFLDALVVSLVMTFGLITMLSQRLNKEVEETRIELTESVSRFRTLFENMIEGVGIHEMIYDADGLPVDYRIISVNHAYENITGIQAESAQGKLGSELYGVDKAPYLEQYQGVFKDMHPHSFEAHFTQMGKDFSISAVPIKTGFFATIFMDITQKKRFEAESKRLLDISESSREALLNILEDQLKVQQSLHESNELLSLFILHSPIYAYIKEVSENESRVLKASENFIDMTGMPGSEMAGKTMAEIFPQEFADKMTKDDWEVASRGIIFKEDEELNGRSYNTIKFPIKLGSRLLLAGYTIDITDRIEAEKEIKKLNETLEQRIEKRTAQLEASNKELEEFSYSVSHDLRAPLRHINGYIDLLSRNYLDVLPEKGKHFLSSIIDASHQMGVLIDDLLQFSRTGRQELNLVEIDMNVLVKEAKNILAQEIEGRQIEWAIEDLPKIQGDLGLLRQVWINLIHNALKFTRYREPAIIRIQYHEKKNEHVFSIHDNGVGFDMKYAQKLFGVFQRFHTTEEFEGTGIGLANVRRTILKHSGTIWAEAEINKGAAFYFAIPKKI